MGGEQFCTWSDFKNPDWFVPECSVLLTSWTAFQWQQILFSPISLFPEGSTIVLLILFVPSLLTRRRFPYLRAPRREDRIIALTSLTCHPAAFQSCSTITYFDPSIWCHNVSIIITYRYIEKQYSLRRERHDEKKKILPEFLTVDPNVSLPIFITVVTHAVCFCGTNIRNVR